MNLYRKRTAKFYGQSAVGSSHGHSRWQYASVCECWQHGSQFDELLVHRMPRPSGGPVALWTKQLCAQGTQSVAKHVPDLYSAHVQFGTRGWPKSSQREQFKQHSGPTHWLVFG